MAEEVACGDPDGSRSNISQSTVALVGAGMEK